MSQKASEAPFFKEEKNIARSHLASSENWSDKLLLVVTLMELVSLSRADSIHDNNITEDSGVAGQVMLGGVVLLLLGVCILGIAKVCCRKEVTPDEMTGEQYRYWHAQTYGTGSGD